MDFLLFLATFVLFFVLTPGVILSLPPKGSKLVTALVHALLFAILLTFFMECFKTDDKEGLLMAGEYPEVYDDEISGGSGICEHGRLKSQCKECGGSGICEHGRLKSQCKECGGRGT